MRSLVILILLSVAISCSKMDDADLENQDADYQQIDEISDSLNSAYSCNSDIKLKTILNNWNSSIQPISLLEITDENKRDIYLIFQTIYNPFNPEILGGHEWGSDLYNGLEYIIVQNKIYYDFNFDVSDSGVIDSIVDFRPDVSFRNVKTLYLTDNYQLALNSFLGIDFCQTVSMEINAPAVPVEESYNRMQFVNQELAILPSRSGSSWYIETHPYISTIHFNDNCTKAFVNFRLGYMFGEATLQKNNDTWEIVSSIINTVE